MVKNSVGGVFRGKRDLAAAMSWASERGVGSILRSRGSWSIVASFLGVFFEEALLEERLAGSEEGICMLRVKVICEPFYTLQGSPWRSRGLTRIPMSLQWENSLSTELGIGSDFCTSCESLLLRLHTLLLH